MLANPFLEYFQDPRFIVWHVLCTGISKKVTLTGEKSKTATTPSKIKSWRVCSARARERWPAAHTATGCEVFLVIVVDDILWRIWILFAFR